MDSRLSRRAPRGIARSMIPVDRFHVSSSVLVADGAGFHVPKGYIYAAIGVSVMVESLNRLTARRRRFRISSATRPDDAQQKIGSG